MAPPEVQAIEMVLKTCRSAGRIEPHELDKIAAATLAYYEQRAEDFRAGTRDHDVSQNISALLRAYRCRVAFSEDQHAKKSVTV
jgi:hypothetical protein